MGEWNPFEMDEFTWNVLQEYLKAGYGETKIYDTTFFSCHLTDETVCMTLYEFAINAVDYDGNLWCEKVIKDYNQGWKDCEKFVENKCKKLGIDYIAILTEEVEE